MARLNSSVLPMFYSTVFCCHWQEKDRLECGKIWIRNGAVAQTPLSTRCARHFPRATRGKWRAVNVNQSHVANARVLGTFSHTTCFPISCALWACFLDRSVSGGRGACSNLVDIMTRAVARSFLASCNSPFFVFCTKFEAAAHLFRAAAPRFLKVLMFLVLYFLYRENTSD